MTHTVQEVLCKMFKTLFSYALFLRVLQMQFSFPRSLRSKRFRASLTEMLGYAGETRAAASKFVELLRGQALRVGKREEKLACAKKKVGER